MNNIIVKEFKKEGFKITINGKGIKIEVTDYHPIPLILDKKELEEIGLCIIEDSKIGIKKIK